MSTRAFVFMYYDMNVGGIQKHIYNYLLNFHKNKIDTYWICPEKAFVDQGFAKEVDKVTKISGKISASLKDKLKSYDSVVALSFSLLQFEKMKKKLDFLTNVKYVYLIPHFANPELFPEEFFSAKCLSAKAKHWSGELYRSYISKNQLFFINEKHSNAVCDNYSISKDGMKERIAPKAREIPPQNEDVIQKKLDDPNFNIITVSRFEFPHKGYILGLVDSFVDFFAKCPCAKLYIIGQGEGEERLNKKIKDLSPDVQKAIILPGRVPYSDLKEYYDMAHLSVAVAGSVIDGASFSVPTLVARHYCESCETYGQYINCSNKTLSEDSGEPVLEYIVNTYKMEKTEYMALCNETYKTAEQILKSNYDPLWMFSIDAFDSQTLKPRWYVLAVLNMGATCWLWKNRFKMLFKNPKVFFEKIKRKLKI